ncbi:MAG: ABC transporter ATP-binding protein/permease, partial [Mycobacteriales bacterium]
RGPGRAGRTPLPWLGALLIGYLLIPLAGYVERLATTPSRSLATPGLGAALVTSLVTATVATAVIAVTGVPLAYLLARPRGWVARVLGFAVALPLALPPLVSGILLLLVVGPYTPLGRLASGRLTDDLAGIVIAQVFVAAPFLIISARSAFAAVDPGLAEAARTLGHGPWSRFSRVAVPTAAAGIRAGLLLAWLRAFGEFGATVLLAYHPYSLPVFTFVQFSGTGLDATLLPTAAALTAAGVVVAVAALPARRVRRSPPWAEGPAPTRPPPPGAARPTTLQLDIVARRGGFTVAVRHTTGGPRLALLGSSGAGKSTTLRALAGVLPVDRASFRIGARELSALPPERRNIGYLPQDAALLPHAPVWRQASFGVGSDPALARWWLHRLGVADLVDRLPSELSGGQRRRVALVRALARAPELLLLDEPCSGLDQPTREDLRRDLRALQQSGHFATVLVTHDPDEAAFLADDVIVLDAGRVLQRGPVGQVLAHPASLRVATLLGIANHGTGEIRDHQVWSGRADLGPAPAQLSQGDRVSWAVRAESVLLSGAGAPRARVIDVAPLSFGVEVLVELTGGLTLRARAAGCRLAPGASCAVEVAAGALLVWPGDVAGWTGAQPLPAP